MTFLATLNRMAPSAVKRAATTSIKPTAVALSQKRFNSTAGTQVRQYTKNIFSTITAEDKKIYQMTVREALNQALEEEMIKDQNVYIMGEEVAQYNGAYKVNKVYIREESTRVGVVVQSKCSGTIREKQKKIGVDSGSKGCDGV